MKYIINCKITVQWAHVQSLAIYFLYICCTAALCNSLQIRIKSECCLLHSKSELGNLLVGVLRPDMEESFLQLIKIKEFLG